MPVNKLFFIHKIFIYYRNFNINLQEYFTKGKENNFSKPEICPFCKKSNSCLIGWGRYKRWATDNTGSYFIYIKLFKCKTFNRYISIHPTFLIPYKQNTLHVIYRVLQLYYFSGLSMKKSLRKVFSNQNIFKYQIIQSWIKTLTIQAQLWITLLQIETGSIPKPLSHECMNRSAPLVHLFRVLEKYFNECKTPFDIEIRYGDLINKYRGSPFTNHIIK